MVRNSQRSMTMAAVLAMAAAAVVTGVARAETTTVGSVTISGSTAFAAFFQSAGATNDFVDVNNDGIFGFNDNGGSSELDVPFVQQLAPTVTISGGALTGYTTGTNINGAGVTAQWSVQYRGTGSVNGLTELVKYALNGTLPTSTQLGDPSSLNRTVVSSGGSSAFNGVGGFPQNAPLTSIDAGVLDVAVTWGVQGGVGQAKWNAKPTAAGYGQNEVLPAGAATQNNKLATLTSGNQSLNLNTVTPDSKTVYGTGIAFAPISMVTNHGTGLQNVKQSELAFMYVTGRAADGTNYVVATRDIGSGTRNGAMNSLGVDPSFGTGDNLGDFTTTPATQRVLGPHFQPTNLDATGTMGAVVQNSRLAVGYVSTTTGKSAQGTGLYESLGVQFDLAGGTGYVRPTADTLINNGSSGSMGTGYRIGGVETFATVGDPLATAVNAMFPALATNPAMASTQTALYIRNIYQSILGYSANPNATSNTFMPAQALLSSNFIPLGALKQVQSDLDPTNWVNNAAFSSAVNASAAGITGLTTGAYGSGTAAFGVVPTRETLSGANTYSDGQVNTYRFYDNTGAKQTIAAGVALNLRNAIAGDFNNDGVRDAGDVTELMSAVGDAETWAMAHHSGSAGTTLGTAAIPEILGDFNGDGSFDSKDVRYFADGLAIAASGPHAGVLDRKVGFASVDNAWTVTTAGHPAGNYFNTTIGTGKAYTAGDSRGDVAGSVTGPRAGAGPTGADGAIDGKDITYVLQQVAGAMGNGTEGSFAALLTRAVSDPTVNVRADLSADINGDLKIDTADVDELVHGILGTEYGDVTLDRKVDALDLNVLAAHWQQPSGSAWVDGDFSGDGKVDALDLNVLASHWQFGAGEALSFAEAVARMPVLAAAVPEPATLGVLALGGMLILRRRRA